jgi:putative addiction module killer protein
MEYMKAAEYKIFHYAMPSGKRPFQTWFNAQSEQVQLTVNSRLERATMGNLGDVRSVGSGVMEFKWASGIRVYFGFDKGVMVILLCGGDKKTQNSDIGFAKKYWKNYKERT